jgi:hypothetical protein
MASHDDIDKFSLRALVLDFLITFIDNLRNLFAVHFFLLEIISNFVHSFCTKNRYELNAFTDSLVNRNRLYLQRPGLELRYFLVDFF